MTFDLSSLNPEQRDAVTSTEGPLLVLAGAGSGKTRVITARIAYLIRQKRVPPDSILALTFTNKAAREMAGRVARLSRSRKGRNRNAAGDPQAPHAPHAPLISTFHSFGVRLLRAHIEKLGYRANFTIFDGQDQQSVVRTLLEEGDYDMGTLSVKEAHFTLQNAKSRGITARELASHVQDPFDLQLAQLMDAYGHTLKRLNAIDFEDILILSLELCREHPQSAAKFFSRFRYVLVDEYQDTNRRQYELLRSLVAGHGNLCVVGDDDQSIYGWRGAEPGNILDFEQDFPGVRVVRLERNYRSTANILTAANQVIRNNAKRKEKTLRPTRGPGEFLEWLVGEDEREELEKVVTHLKLTRLREGAGYNDFAILYRSNHQSRLVEEMLREEGIPYRLLGGTRFFDRREVKDALAYLRLVHAPQDEVSLLRVINFPRRGIGRTSQMRLMDLAASEERPALEIMAEAGRRSEFAGAPGTAMERFAALISRGRVRFRGAPLGTAFREMLAELDFARAVEKEQKDPKAAERASELVYELELAVERFAERREGAGIREFLEHVALLSLPEEADDGERTPMVSLLTVHGAKGLEFPNVYMVQLAEEVFPNRRALAGDGEDEERRLFYVAVTRAKRRLTFSMARSRRRFGETIKQQPSRYLLEIGAELFDGPAPVSDFADTRIRRESKAREAKSRFFDQVRRLQDDGQPAQTSEPAAGD